MKRPILIVVIAGFLLASPFAQGGSAADETRATLRQYVLELINRDRAQNGLPPVALDVRTSETGDEYCRSQIANRTTGHFTTDGLAPYMRYSFAGGNDAVSENAAAWSADYRFSPRALYEMASRSEQSMMAEVPPHDGHRKTILDPHATHVGIGLAWDRGEFRIVQEFVRRHVEWISPVARESSTHDRPQLRGRAARGMTVEGITVHYEPFPSTMPAHVASAIDSYSLPKARDEYRPRRARGRVDEREAALVRIAPRRYSDGTFGDFALASDGAFSFQVAFTRGPGVYTVVVWLRKSGESEAFSASTTSIRVTQPQLRASSSMPQKRAAPAGAALN